MITTEGAENLALPSRVSVAGAFAAGVLCATLVPAAPPGLDLFIAALAIAAAVLGARPAHISLQSAGLGALSLSLAFVPVLRSAGWVIGLDLLFAVALACWSVGSLAAWPDFAKALLAPVSRIPLVPRALAGALQPRGQSDRFPVGSFLRGALLAAGMLAVFGVLFVSADAAFAYFARILFPDALLGHWMALRLFLFVIVPTGSLALIMAGERFGRPPVNRLVDSFLDAIGPREGGSEQLAWRVRPAEWMPALTMLVLLFAAFVAVQLAVLFGGRDHVLKTAGLTYADYARQGFWQLILAAALTLGLIAGASFLFDRSAGREETLFRLLCGGLCVMTLVILTSALHRLSLYESAFGFTRPRIAAHALIIWLAGLFALVIGLGATRFAGRLPFVVVAFTAVGALGFSLSNPDQLIARRNVDRFRTTGKIDAEYLGDLSADAVPALARLPAEVGTPIMRSIALRLDRRDPWTSWNLARARARKLIPPSP